MCCYEMRFCVLLGLIETAAACITTVVAIRTRSLKDTLTPESLAVVRGWGCHIEYVPSAVQQSVNGLFPLLHRSQGFSALSPLSVPTQASSRDILFASFLKAFPARTVTVFRIGSFSSIERVLVDFEGGSPLMRIGTGISAGSVGD